MKKLKSIIICATNAIKKKFFKVENNDICHHCEKAFGFAEKADQESEKLQQEEYLKNYNVTTRWQTV